MKRVASRGGPGRRGIDVSDTSRDYEFTRWQAVNASAHHFARRLNKRTPLRDTAGMRQLARNGLGTAVS